MTDTAARTARARVPFAAHAMVETLEAPAGLGRARIPHAPELTNHVQSVHAGALFTLAETASGAAMVGAFHDIMGQVRPLVRQSEIRYLKVARGIIAAEARLGEPTQSIRNRLDAAGRADFTVEVALTDAANQTVAEVSVTWNLRKLA